MTARRPLDPDLARILATILAHEDFAEPHQLLETHDLGDILTAFSAGLIRCVTRTKDGHQGFALAPKGEQAMRRPADAGFRLKVDVRVDALEQATATLRRDQQQLLIALQEIARKVQKHEQMAAKVHVAAPPLHVGPSISVGTPFELADPEQTFSGFRLGLQESASC